MKFGAIFCTYNDHEYLDISINSIKQMVDRVIILISDKPWNGDKTDNTDTIKHIKDYCQNNSNVELFQGSWSNEVDQRNEGLSILFNMGITYAFIIDTDEIFHQHHFNNVRNLIKNNPTIAAYYIEINTYWNKDYYRISPRENYHPLIAVRVDSFIFTGIRMGTPSIIRTKYGIFPSEKEQPSILIPPQIAIMFHLSYARSDSFVKDKIVFSSHSKEIDKNWYEDIWLKWNPGMRNLHPITPKQYPTAVKEDFSIFPDELKLFIKKEKLKERLCSIIILNWNSCDMLKKCLENILKYTNMEQVEILIVDNGSTKDDSVEFIKTLRYKTILNTTNLGFPAGVSQAMKTTSGSDVCLLNVDAEVQENWLDYMYDTLMENPSCGIVGPLGNIVPSGYQCKGYVDKDTEAPNLMGFCMLIMREVIDKIGYFDPLYGLGGYDDNDFGFRAQLAGFSLFLSSKSLVIHKANQVFERNNLNYFDYDEANKNKFFSKYYQTLYNLSKINNLFGNSALADKLGLIIK